jgi:hypothetical protein
MPNKPEFTPCNKPYALYVERAHEAAGFPASSDPEERNERRIFAAQRAVAAYQRATRTDHQDALKDLLCDLRHLAVHIGEDFDHLNEIAQMNFDTETESEEL